MKVVFSERRIGKLDSCNSDWRLNLVLMINKHSCIYYIYVVFLVVLAFVMCVVDSFMLRGVLISS